MKQWCTYCGRMTEHNSGGCAEHNMDIHASNNVEHKSILVELWRYAHEVDRLKEKNKQMLEALKRAERFYNDILTGEEIGGGLRPYQENELSMIRKAIRAVEGENNEL